MPTDAAQAAGAMLRLRRIVRLAAGTAAALWISQAGGWTLSYIAPLLTLTLLALPMPRPPAKMFVLVLVAVVASVYGGFIFLPMLLYQPLAGLLLLALALFHSFYHTARGAPAVIGTFVTIGLTLTVAVGSVSVDALVAVAGGVTIGSGVAVAIVVLSHTLLPDPAGHPRAAAGATTAPKPTGAAACRRALRSMSIVLPVTAWFLISSASASNAAVMIKVASMGQQASTEGARTVARSLLMSTLAGGGAAVVAWEVLSIWPSLTMYTLLIAVAGVLFGDRIFARGGQPADAATWSYAFLTMVVVLAPAVLDSQFGSAADTRFYTRLLMFIGASLYGVGAARVFDAFFPPVGEAQAKPEATGPQPGEAAA